MVEDEYKTIKKPSKMALFKDRSSKFYGYAFPVANEKNIKKNLDSLKKEHPTARHFCYAYKLGFQEPYVFRANDDGEPNNSAGMPIHGQLEAYEVTNILVVVVRYFGGTKLGVGGLISAYRTTASIALENSLVITKTVKNSLQLNFGYEDMNDVMRIIKDHNLQIISNTSALSCEIVIRVRLRDYEEVVRNYQQLYKVDLKQLFD